MIIGTPFSWIAGCAIHASVVQRFLSLPSKKSIRNALIIYIIGMCVLMHSNCFVGFLIFAKYESCDPLSTNKIQKVDQILPYYIMEVAKKVPGLPGLFVAGIFSAALSTMSSSWNSLAGTVFEDLIRPFHPNIPEKAASNIMKAIVFFLGVITIGLVFLVERLGTVFSLVISIQGVTYGTLLGIFTFGMTCRRGNTKVQEICPSR